MHEISTELGTGSDHCHPIEKHGHSQWLPGAGQDDGNMPKISPHGITERKRRAVYPILEVYYFHIS